MNSLTCRFLSGILIFCPLAFGTVEAWSITVMEIACFLAALVLFVSISLKKKTLYEVPGIVPLLLFLAYLLFQVTPLPAWFLRILSPATYDIYLGTVGILDMPDLLTLSINKGATLGEFFRFASYASLYVLTVQVLTDRECLEKTVRLVLVLAFGIALLAIFQHFTSDGKFFWIREAPPRSTWFGPYIYHNHFAGFMEMLVPVALSLFFYYRPRYSYEDSFRNRVTAAFDHPLANIHALLCFAAVVMAASVFLSLSRGGIISLSLSCLLLLTFLVARDRKRYTTALVLVFFIGTVLAVTWFGWEDITARFARINDNIEGGRFMFWKDCIGIIRDFPLFGVGVGSFGNIFPAYRTFPGSYFVYNAHNDYIQTLTEAGAVGSLFILCFLGSVVCKTLRTIKKRREQYSVHLWLGCMAGMLALMIHSVTDFNFQNGANALYFFFLAGLSVSAANTGIRGRTRTRLTSSSQSRTPALAAMVLAAVLGMSVGFNSWKLIALSHANAIGPMNWTAETSEDELKRVAEKASKASANDPMNSYYHFVLAYSSNLLGDKDSALGHYERALALNPVQATYHQEFGLFLSEQGRNAEAEAFLKAGIRHDRSDADRYREYAKWLLSVDERRRGLEGFRDVFSLGPEKAKGDIVSLAEAGFGDNEIREALPDRVRPWLALGDYLRKKGNETMAEEVYRTALAHVGREKKAEAGFFHKVAGYYTSKKRYDDAIAVMRQAIETLPDNTGLRIRTAGLYEKTGITHRALEEYRKALTLEPGNRKAGEGLLRTEP